MWTLMLFNAIKLIIYCISNQMHLQTIEKKVFYNIFDFLHLTISKYSQKYF